MLREEIKTVGELIEELENYPPDCPIWISSTMYSGAIESVNWENGTVNIVQLVESM